MGVVGLSQESFLNRGSSSQGWLCPIYVQFCCVPVFLSFLYFIFLFTIQ